MNTLEQNAIMDSVENADQTQTSLPPSAPDQPVSIYEVHLPSWMRVPEEHNRPLTLSEIAPKLAEHLKFMNFTHVQLHSTDEGNGEQLKFLIRHLHQHSLGVILETGSLPKNKSDLDADSEQQKELQAKAKDILLQIVSDGPQLLRARLEIDKIR